MAEESIEPPSERNPQYFQYVQVAVENRLSNYSAWPSNLFQLELEGSGIYQDFSGLCLQELQENGIIDKTRINEKPYMYKAEGNPPKPSTEIQEATERIYYYLSGGYDYSGVFAELVLYVALSKVHQELNDYIDIGVYSKGYYTPLLQGLPNELDALLELNSEYYPIDVFNGSQYADENHHKIDRAEEYDSNGDPVRNPVIAVRLSGVDAKKKFRERNGTIIDTRAIMVCEPQFPEMPNAIETLNLQNQFLVLPRLTTEGGLELDGEIYNMLTDDRDEYWKITRREVITAADQLPEEYIRRIRGGVHLLYTNSLYRQVEDQDTKRACLVLQAVFPKLLRNPGLENYTRIIDDGWEEAQENYSRIMKPVENSDAIKDATQDLLTQLEDENVITRRHGKIYVRASDPPHSSLSGPF